MRVFIGLLLSVILILLVLILFVTFFLVTVLRVTVLLLLLIIVLLILLLFVEEFFKLVDAVRLIEVIQIHAVNAGITHTCGVGRFRAVTGEINRLAIGEPYRVCLRHAGYGKVKRFFSVNMLNKHYLLQITVGCKYDVFIGRNT